MPKLTNNISYQTLEYKDSIKIGTSPASKRGMPKDENVVIPVSNIPDGPEGLDYTNDHDFKIMSLRRRIASLLADKANVNDKVTFALQLLVDEFRYWTLGMREGQWETYSQIERRVSKLKGGIDHLLHDHPTKHTMLDELNKILEKEKKAQGR